MSPTPIPSASGKIKSVFIICPDKNEMNTPEEFIRAYYSDLLNQFSHDVTFYIVIKGASDVYNNSSFTLPITKVLETPENIPLNFWTQDIIEIVMVPGLTGGTPKLIYNYAHQSLIKEISSMFNNLLLQESPIKFEGGDLLYGRLPRGYYSLTSPDIRKTNWQPDIEDKMRELFGISHIVWIAPYLDDLFKGAGLSDYLGHIDMYITLTGQFSEQEQLILVGEVTEDLMFPIFEHQISEMFNVKEALDRIAEWLEGYTLVDGLRFRVKRIPLVLVGRSSNAPKQMYPITYNNCHIEEYEGHRIAYLPKYSERSEGFLKKFLENVGAELREEEFVSFVEKIEEIEQKLSVDLLNHFTEIKWVKGIFLRPHLEGSLHCHIKVIQRS